MTTYVWDLSTYIDAASSLVIVPPPISWTCTPTLYSSPNQTLKRGKGAKNFYVLFFLTGATRLGIFRSWRSAVIVSTGTLHN